MSYEEEDTCMSYEHEDPSGAVETIIRGGGYTHVI